MRLSRNPVTRVRDDHLRTTHGERRHETWKRALSPTCFISSAPTLTPLVLFHDEEILRERRDTYLQTSCYSLFELGARLGFSIEPQVTVGK